MSTSTSTAVPKSEALHGGWFGRIRVTSFFYVQTVSELSDTPVAWLLWSLVGGMEPKHPRIPPKHGLLTLVTNRDRVLGRVSSGVSRARPTQNDSGEKLSPVSSE